MKHLIIYTSSALALIGAAQAAITTLLPTQAVSVTDDGNASSVGSLNITSTAGDLAGVYHIRERRNATQSNRQISSFFQFDLSSITITDTTTPGFNATFTIEYDSQLNNLTPSNDAPAILGRVGSGDGWDPNPANGDLPLHNWGFDESGPSTVALDPQALIANIPGTAPTGQEVTLDVTSIVTSWVDGTNDNYGFVLFIDELEAQGAGFSNPELIVDIPAVPEPSSFALLALGLLPLARRKR